MMGDEGHLYRVQSEDMKRFLWSVNDTTHGLRGRLVSTIGRKHHFAVVASDQSAVEVVGLGVKHQPHAVIPFREDFWWLMHEVNG